MKPGDIVKIIDPIEIGYEIPSRAAYHNQFIGHIGEIRQPARADWTDGIIRWEVEGAVSSSGIPFAIQERFLQVIK